ncbi:16S rRNA (cytosine(1402)-N(4))-methyltransferase RsmH [Akkermansia sp.]|uniref:16S rRNA (cytosine(1402)-N(4))-methyltransferase RsmH n=1 Tax=Akkermansia sp. TaxID=1872421 RepID=UPI0025C5E8EA|nr:16S rRNA (cytosine(1402)-N(4))-methyltransferase RsmH [Akkermansia sp.]
MGDDAVSASADAETDGAVSGNGFNHVTVLLHETVDMLAAGPGKLIVDCTLGGGGHTEFLLEQGATVWGIDRDPDARRAATLKLARFGSRFKVLAGNFQDVESILAQQGVSQVDGLLADLGVSSHQLDTASRGFSFREDGPLDMRMDTRAAFSARNLVNEAPEEEIADILWQFGEERASRAIARAIVKARSLAPITTTAQLARVVESVLPRKGRQHPGTRTFQALRIAVNGEMEALDALLDSSVRLLGKGGRMAVITFHSLEDRRVKQFFDLRSRPEIDRPEWPAPRPNPDYCFRLLSRKPVTAGEEELSTNPRSRSAKLRGVEKII